MHKVKTTAFSNIRKGMDTLTFGSLKPGLTMGLILLKSSMEEISYANESLPPSIIAYAPNSSAK